MGKGKRGGMGTPQKIHRQTEDIKSVENYGSIFLNDYKNKSKNQI